MPTVVQGVVLVGHGGVPKDCPPELISKLKRLEAQRRAAGMPQSAEEQQLDASIRRWPRSAANDPYQAGLEAVGAALQPLLGGALFALAYNEFCAPTVEESNVNPCLNASSEAVGIDVSEKRMAPVAP